jgi:chromosome segregation ATPase
MSEQENKTKIENLTKQLVKANSSYEHMKRECDFLKTLHMSSECNVKDLEKEIRIKKSEISNCHQHVQANALKMLQMSERITELELAQPASGATEREKELDSELKKSQDQRRDLQTEFEEMRGRYEKSDKYKTFFQLMTEHDTPEIKSLTVDQFDKKIKRFFKMLSDLYPDDKQKCLDHGKRVGKLLMTRIHPDKNSSDPRADEKFVAFNQAYENFINI